jgi:hypothetical protein
VSSAESQTFNVVRFSQGMWNAIGTPINSVWAGYPGLVRSSIAILPDGTVAVALNVPPGAGVGVYLFRNNAWELFKHFQLDGYTDILDSYQLFYLDSGLVLALSQKGATTLYRMNLQFNYTQEWQKFEGTHVRVSARSPVRWLMTLNVSQRKFMPDWLGGDPDQPCSVVYKPNGQ